MVEHLVFFKKKPGATAEQEQRLLEALRGLKDKIPGILELSCGTNITPERGQGCTVGLRVLMKDEEALRAYGPHPAHQAVVAISHEYAQDVIVVDFVRES